VEERLHQVLAILHHLTMDVGDLLRHQSGVVSRRQALARGFHDDDIARLIRRREWARMFPGVYVAHTGPPTWIQRAWGATLLHAPAALASWSALRAAGAEVQTPKLAVSLVVASHRRVVDPPGVSTRRTQSWDRDVLEHLSPPRQRLEIAALWAASEASSNDAAVALLGDLVQDRRTTAGRLLAALDDLRRLPRRRLLGDVLADVESGALSALERRYLRDVERSHALPGARRQRPIRPQGRLQVRDVDYAAYGLTVELDGRLGHELWRDRWRDLGRDIDSIAVGTTTVRAGWGQVLEPCRLAQLVGRILALRGWAGKPAPCRPGCESR
jgi:hypothetical protein